MPAHGSVILVLLVNHFKEDTKMSFPLISRKYVIEYLDLLAVGATHEEAIHGVAVANSVSIERVLA
jgi:hypothetical protein